jgi:hypothetical protein
MGHATELLSLPIENINSSGAAPQYTFPASVTRMEDAGTGLPLAPRPRLRAGNSRRFIRAPGQTFFATGTGMPATFRLTEPSMVRLVKNSVFQSLPPKPMFVVAGWP